MKQSVGTVLIVALAAFPMAAHAQGGRGQRGQRSEGNDSTAGTGAPRVKLSFVDMVFARRKDLQLTEAEVTKVGEIRMDAQVKRIQLTRDVDAAQAEMADAPAAADTPPTDSSRKAMMTQRRALAAMLGDLHDVDVNARKATLAVLTPDQQKNAETIEEAADAPPPKKTGVSGSGGGGRPNGGGMGGIGL